ncbi:MAG: hypothetical protein R3B72_38055 [Polyangiaceae bacterium]
MREKEGVAADVLDELAYRSTRLARSVRDEIVELLETADEPIDLDSEEFVDDWDFDTIKELAFEYRAGDPRPDDELKALILDHTDGGATPFYVGITFRPSARTSYYRRRGCTQLVVLCRCEFYGSARTLEKRLVRWAHAKKLNVRNIRNTPPGQRARRFKWYRLYIAT